MISAAAASVSTGESVTFWILAPIAVVCALAMVIAKNAVHCALFLAGVMLSLAGLYALQDAPFLAAVQVIVYTGAILMLFLFVLMLVGVDSSDSLVETLRGQRATIFLPARGSRANQHGGFNRFSPNARGQGERGPGFSRAGRAALRRSG